MKPASEKRSYYRINDLIGFSCSLIDATAGDASTSSGAPADLLGEIDREFNQAANTLWLENPVIAQALGLLNRKLGILAAHVLPGEGTKTQSCEEMLVSLSGSGVGFDFGEPFPERARVLMCLVLKPAHTFLELTGIVAGCELQEGSDGNSYRVRVTFEAGNEAAQEQLIQHIVQRECAQLRERASGSQGEPTVG